MKIAITGDFHFGFNDDALEQARRVLLDAKSKADFVIAAGDLFDFRVPKQEVVYDAVRVFNEARVFNSAVKVVVRDGEKETPADTHILGIYGTHERRTKGLVNVIELLHASGTLVNCHARKVFVSKTTGGKTERVCVQAMGGIPEELAKKALQLMEFSPEEDCFNVFVFHQSLSELIPGESEMLSISDLPEGFDLYVNGHIHWRHDISEAGKRLLIAGSTVVTQMKANETKPKGYFLFDTEAGKAEFVVVRTRPFFFEEVSLHGDSLRGAEEKVSFVLSQIFSKIARGDKPLVKLKVSGTLASGLAGSNLDLSRLERDYHDKMFLSIDKHVGSIELKEKIDLLRKIRGEKKGAREMGFEILRKKLSAVGALQQLPQGSEEELFDMLCSGDVDGAVKLLAA